MYEGLAALGVEITSTSHAPLVTVSQWLEISDVIARAKNIVMLPILSY